MKNEKTKLRKFEVVCDMQMQENSICSNLKHEERKPNGDFFIASEKEKNGWPIAHYIGASYDFHGEDSKIQNTLGLAGYFPVAHKDFNDFYGSLKGGKSDYLKFNSLEKRITRDFDANNEASSKDLIICPLDSYYKPSDNERIDLDKIEKGELILDSIELAKRINKKGLKGKVDVIVYDKGFSGLEYEKWLNDENSLDEDDSKYLNRLKNIGKKYGITFLEKIDLPYPFLLYEHLRNLNTNLFE